MIWCVGLIPNLQVWNQPNAPYHSEFNPIEYVFSLLRKEIQKNTNRTREEIINTINNFIKNVNPEYLINIFNHSFKLLDNFLQ